VFSNERNKLFICICKVSLSWLINNILAFVLLFTFEPSDSGFGYWIAALKPFIESTNARPHHLEVKISKAVSEIGIVFYKEVCSFGPTPNSLYIG
jgi:hypothetical protein